VKIPRTEYPRPQFERKEWINLNGEWTYVFDHGRSGIERGFAESRGFKDKIIVPFSPESRLSGVGYTDFISCMWYHRKLSVPKSWKGKNIILNFGAVDYMCEAYIDGNSIGRHYGGSSSFSFNISSFITSGKQHNLVVRVVDEIRSNVQPAGKQSRVYHSKGCLYTRTTGIWQTVWLECVNQFGLKRCSIIPDFDSGSLVFKPEYFNVKRGNLLRITVNGKGNESHIQEFSAVLSGVPYTVYIENPREWSPHDPFLYDIKMEVVTSKGKVLDRVKSYAGLRKIHIEGKRIFLNNKELYLRMVLDQGFYPDGIWTAPSDRALKKDIELGLAAGFNGARLHQKVFDERYHYWADRLGYLTWGEFPSWGISLDDEISARNFISEWSEVVTRDMNHPSIITWTPFNETRIKNFSPDVHDRMVTDVVNITRALDPTRPVNDTCDGRHVDTDIWTIHTYIQDPARLEDVLKMKNIFNLKMKKQVDAFPYRGQPMVLSEFGGTFFSSGKKLQDKDRKKSWGYGDTPKNKAKLYKRMKNLVRAIESNRHFCGYCYTQLTDVEQEQNGIYDYYRRKKDKRLVADIFSEH
jgi:beta-galactosidase/beta-glucuronidase